MRLVVFGGTGMIGKAIVAEAIRRGHEATAITRNGSGAAEGARNLAADILSVDSVAAAVAGADAVITAFGPGAGDPQILVTAAHSLLAGMGKAGVRRLLIVGGAGVLEVAPGVQLVDTPNFPPALKGLALAHRDAWHVYRESSLDWTFVSPAAMIEPGERTGKFRLGSTKLVVDETGNSRISTADYAIAMIDEAEKNQQIRKQMTAAY